MTVFILISTLVIWLGMGVFSYLWVNKAIILMLLPSNPNFGFLLNVVETANQNRHWLWAVWLLMLGLLTISQLWWLKNSQIKLTAKKIWVVVGLIELIASLSFPFISDDIYSYLYSGKMVVEYHQNPYIVMPKENFGKDQWLWFVKNVDNVYYHIGDTPITYYYGPVFLAYTAVLVKFVGSSRFLGLFIGWKILNWVWFMLIGWLLTKLVGDKGKVMAYWYANPLLQFELLVNSHNDLLMIGLFLAALLVLSKHKLWGWMIFLGSVLVKFVSAVGLVLFLVKDKYREKVFLGMGMLILIFHAVRPLHLWYYSWIYMFLPMTGIKTRTWVVIFLGQLVLMSNYVGYIWFNRWIGAPFLPSSAIIRWCLVTLVLASEWERILKINLVKYKYFKPK